MSSRSVTADEQQTEYYREVFGVFGVLGVGQVLYGIVRSVTNGHEPIVQISMYRAVDAPPFSTADADALRDVLHYFGQALATTLHVPTAVSAEQTAEESMAVLNEAGEVIFADDLWMRLTRMARGEAISLGQARDEPKALKDFLRGVVITARAAKKSLHVVNSAWDQFAFRHHELGRRDRWHGNGAGGVAPSRSIGAINRRCGSLGLVLAATLIGVDDCAGLNQRRDGQQTRRVRQHGGLSPETGVRQTRSA